VTAPQDPGPGSPPARGVWVALALVGGAVLVFAVLVLTSGVLGS
jgi:hypothetical protein